MNRLDIPVKIIFLDGGHFDKVTLDSVKALALSVQILCSLS